jgi:hypothetical protein
MALLDLALTRGQGKKYDTETLDRIKTQTFQYNFEIAERKRLMALVENQRLNEIRQQKILDKVESLELKSKTINYNLADKISKIIPYSLIPVIPVVIAFFILSGRK